MFKDSNKRSLVKGISWRVLGTLDTFLLAWFFLGDFSLAAPIALIEVATKIPLYYLHERIWNRWSWGRKEGHVSHMRSIFKGVSWRVFGSIDTILISWIYAGNPWGALKIGVSEAISKILLFYLHERLWTAIRWGRVLIEEPEELDVEKK